MKRLRALLVAALVAVWLAPDAMALAVGVHLLVEDHHQTSHENTDDHHETNAWLDARHAHELTQNKCSFTPRPAACTVAPRAATDQTVLWRLPVALVSPDAAPSPPVPRFLSHCSLLI